MKTKFYILIFLVVACGIYAAYSTYNMMFNNKTPYTVSCDGVALDSDKVIAISNYNRHSPDTLFVNFEKSKVIMPSTLGYIYYDQGSKQFLLKNNTCIFNPENTIPDNYFLPFCRTLDGSVLNKAIYYGQLADISQEVLVKRGIKYNSAVGTAENRVKIRLINYSDQLFLNTNDDGIGTKYNVIREVKNQYDIAINHTLSNSLNTFMFDNTSHDTGLYNLNVTANTFSISYQINDLTRKTITKGSGIGSVKLTIGKFLFSLTPKYTKAFAWAFTAFLLIIFSLQFYFLRLYTKTASPVIKALFSIRILFNCIVFLAIPLFLTSYYLTDNREYYLVLVILLNLSFFTSKKILHNINMHDRGRIFTWLMLSIIIAAPFFMLAFTRNESLFGIVPVLHVQKGMILILIMITQDYWKNSKHKTIIRTLVIMGYTAVVSTITSDVGTLIYTALALALIELVSKRISLRTFVAGVIAIVSVTVIAIQIYPDALSQRKVYRIVAPYYDIESSDLSVVNEADREFTSTLLLGLKNIAGANTPKFNDAKVPANMRSTCHSDFSFFWSLMLGGTSFLLLFITVTFLLVSDLVLLLYCSIRPCNIGEGRSFSFPLTSESQLTRFLLAFTIISVVYPVMSNFLIIPITGQSIPCLSISNIEIIFLIFLIFSISSIYTNAKYITENSTTIKYQYIDAKKSMRYALFCMGCFFITAFALRSVSLIYINESLSWKKHISDEHLKFDKEKPQASDKEGLVKSAKSVIGTNKLTSVDKKKKPFLKELASLYYSNKPYSETIYESMKFNNCSRKLLSQLTIDSTIIASQELISGIKEPFGKVYKLTQNVNNKKVTSYSNPYYNSVPFDAETVSADLSAECARILEGHIHTIGDLNNIGCITIIENETGHIITNSSYPLYAPIASGEVYYLPGSLKKLLIAYAALAINPEYKTRTFKGKSFKEFIKNSDDYYAAALLKELLTKHKDELDKILREDFDMPLYSLTDDGYMDIVPEKGAFKKELDRNNIIYRFAIGQQKPYRFSDVIEWYARFAGGSKVELTYTEEVKIKDKLSIDKESEIFLRDALNNVLHGTANKVRTTLIQNNIMLDDIICKTGTTEKSNKKGNAASSFILSNNKYTIGVMLKGNIPNNNSALAAKDLFVRLIPSLIDYQILKPIQQKAL